MAWLWTLLASVVAVRESLRVATGKAVMTVVVTSVVIAVISLLTGMTMGTMGLVVNRLLPLRG